LGVATGLQDRFDWKSVAAGAIASGVGSAVGQTEVGRTPFIGEVASDVAAGAASTLVRGGSLSRDFGAIAADAVAGTVGNMVADQMKRTPSVSSLYGVGGDVDAMVQDAYPVDLDKQFVWSANARLQPAGGSFDSTAASLGLSTEQALRLIAPLNSASIVDSNGPTSAVAYPVPTPYIQAVEIPGELPLKLTETEGGFWRGLVGDKRNVFETPAPWSEEVGLGVRALGEFIAGPLIELGNQYRDVYSAASGATGGWRSAFAQQVSDGSYGGAALTELGVISGAVPMAGAMIKGLVWAAPESVGSGLSVKPYTGDVYSTDFVGPVRWDYFYRGDSTLRSDFLSSMAQIRGTDGANTFLNGLSEGAHMDVLAEHGVTSAMSPYVSTSKNLMVAEYFARGVGQSQNGFVTTFRIESREAEALREQGLIVPNYENPMAFFENNPQIGLPESEFLFRSQIDSRYIYQQNPVFKP
jgi:hypothetical protein